MSYQVQSPVVFIIFNRPEHAKQVFEKIRLARPSRLLIISDGPRANRSDDQENCAASRRLIDTIDWPCEVLKNYSEVNLGCRKRVSTGLTWAFQQVERAIILEDDCVPNESFFQFCDELLEKYADDSKVMHITGSNFVGEPHYNTSYFFSKFPHVWGWASWRRAWNKYDVDLKTWDDNGPALKKLNVVLKKPSHVRFWSKKFDSIKSGFDTWDYQWSYACLINDGFCVIPEKNLITNIGFDSAATHTKVSTKEAGIKSESLEFPLRHPPMKLSEALDTKYMSQLTRIWPRLKRKVLEFF